MTTQERNAAVEAFYRTHRATLEKKVANRVSGASRALIEDVCQTAWAVLLRRPDIGLRRRRAGILGVGGWRPVPGRRRYESRSSRVGIPLA